MADKGLILLYTGNGKGKTTAALGQALRAAGHGFNITIIQFIKNQQHTGEIKAAKEILADHLEIHPMGTGFTWDAKDPEEVRQAAVKGWELARQKIAGGRYKMVILDELTYTLNYGLVDEDEVLDFLKEKPAGVHIVITGRDASDRLIDIADLVTEMQEIKHPYQNGGKAVKGIEF